ncbi:AAA family ATPase [Pseudoalteromonas sp. T1lg10]|uniref:AAA family ATPase n=1 Tax=Pseudoalteromonas sp. T1lg10 TaxID=2077093 RepID=UPI000CF6211A|nr:AAA family ATPase [Pseudoalteromonas sp. T1lg10]
MNFNNNYTERQQLQVTLINTELEATGMTDVELNCGYALSAVKTILAGESPVNPAKVIDALWQMIFGDADPEQLDAGLGYQDSYSPDDVTLCTRIRLRLHAPELRAQGVTSASIASSLKKSPGTISQLINGKYQAKPSKHLHDIWGLIAPPELEQAKQADAEAERKEPIHIVYGAEPFVDISTVRLITLACEQAKQKRRFSVFSGQAGIGKSKGIAEYCRNDTDAILIEGSEQTTSTQVLEALVYQLGLARSGSGYKNMEKIIKTLRDTNRVIILDEADKCKPNALDPLRTISDRARVGVTLVGNIQLQDKLQTHERYELISSRVCFWPKPVGQITVEDIRTLFLELTQGTVKLAKDDAAWWTWLHKRVEGNARELVGNLLPHLLNHTYKKPDVPVDKLLVNGIFSSVLNKPAV